MIFRGDGKNNIINEDCLSQHLTRKIINVLTAGIVVKKVTHPFNQNVLWVRALKDGYLRVKGRRLFFESEQNDIKDVTLEDTFYQLNLCINQMDLARE